MNGPTIRRLIGEQRARYPLQALFVAAWGFLLVAVFATSEIFSRQLEQQAAQFGSLLELVGLDPLAQWTTIGLQHPVFLLGGGLFAVGLGIRAIAGELEAGSLALALTRPISRGSWFASHLVVLIPGCFAIGLAYAGGALLATTVTDPIGSLEPLRLVAAGLLGGLLLLVFGGLALLISAFSVERGRALAWAVGIVIVMYTASFLLPLWSPTSSLVKVTPFGWFDPGPLLQRGEIAWGDVAVLTAYAVVPISVAAWRFARRDLAGG